MLSNFNQRNNHSHRFTTGSMVPSVTSAATIPTSIRCTSVPIAVRTFIVPARFVAIIFIHIVLVVVLASVTTVSRQSQVITMQLNNTNKQH